MPQRLAMALVVLACATLARADNPAGVPSTMTAYGKMPDGTPVEAYTLVAGPYKVKLIAYGAAIAELVVPDKAGKPTDVALGFDAMEGWLQKGNPYFGCTVGRVANRIGQGKFTLDGKEYTLATNNGPNALHGGLKGFDKQLWKATADASRTASAVKFTYTSKDGEEGYPSTMNVAVTYSLSPKGELKIEYAATCDKPTPVNLTNHTYFNLNGAASPTNVLEHVVQLNCDEYTPTDKTLIPTGQIASVKGTPLDFTTPTPIGKHIAEIAADPIGYDHNFVIRGGGKSLTPCAVVRSPETGIAVEMSTTEPGVQFYTGNFLDGTLTGKGGRAYKKHHGFCLEAQHYPDSINKPNFPSVVLRPGHTYTQTTVYKFGVK